MVHFLYDEYTSTARMLGGSHHHVSWYRDPAAMSYGAAALVISCINNLWVTYNFPFFLKIITEQQEEDDSSSLWFAMVPLAYLLWNTVDNPVLGWWSDRSLRLLGGKSSQSCAERVQRVRVGVRWMACMFALSWFPFEGFAHLHFLVSLCVYGGSLSYVEVNFTSLLAEITPDRARRARCTAWASVFAVLGALPLVYASLMWEAHQSRDSFKGLCLGVSLFAVAFVEGWQIWLSRQFDLLEQHAAGDDDEASVTKAAAEGDARSVGFATLFRQLWQQRNFRWFGGVHFLQTALCTFEKNHLALFVGVFAREAVGAGFVGVLIALSFVLPHVCTIVASTFIPTRGLWSIMRIILQIKLASVATGFVFCALWWNSSFSSSSGSTSGYVGLTCALVLLFGRVVTESLCRMFPLVTATIIEQDSALHQRRFPVAASIAGSVALLARPGESLAPWIGWILLTNVEVLRDALLSGEEGNDDDPAAVGVLASSSSPRFHARVLCVVLLFPAVCAILAMLCWARTRENGRASQRDKAGTDHPHI